jgi:hypothetical protein
MSGTRYSVETRWGGSEEDPSAERLAELIAELDTPDEEHPDTWLTHHESGWTIRLDEERFAYLEDQDLNVVSHIAGLGAAVALDLWLRFSLDGPSAVASDHWLAGPRVRTAEEVAAIHERSRQLTEESDRQFFESLGPEDPSRQCKRAGCGGGTIKYSVLCAAHHFEQVRGKPYPRQSQSRGSDA